MLSQTGTTWNITLFQRIDMAVTFQPEGHRYTNENGEVYISVTTLIGKYKAPFDAQYWSTYKAVKLVLEKKGTWDRFKRRAGGWDKVVAYYNSLNDFPYHAEVARVKIEFLQSWAETGRIAREKGSDYHAQMEDISHKLGVEKKNGKEIKVCSPVDLLRLQDFENDGVYTELLLYNDHFRLAGMADKVIKEGRIIHIHDYKTSKEIEMEAFQDEKMKHPIHHLPSCNYFEYSLQLSIYAWMLEQVGYTVGDLVIEHVPANHKEYKVKYLRDEVQSLLSHYGNAQNFPPYHFKPSPQRGEGESFVYPMPKPDQGESDFSICFE